MRKTDENGQKPKQVNRRSDENVVENNTRINIVGQSQTRNNIPENPADSTSRFTFSGLRGGVTDFLRRIHWQPNSNTILEDSNSRVGVGRSSRQLIQEGGGSGSRTIIKSKGSKTTASTKIIKANKTKANELETTENIEKEARRLKRRRRSSRTKKIHERRDGDVEYFSGRHLEEQPCSTRRGHHQDIQENEKEKHSSENEEQHLQNYFPYGDTGTRERNHQTKRGLGPVSETKTSEGEIIPISSTDLGKIISEGEIPPSVPQKPSEGEVISEPNKFKFPHEISPSTTTTATSAKASKVNQSATKRKKKLRQPQKQHQPSSPRRLVLRTKPKPSKSESVKAVNADEGGVRRSRRDKFKAVPPSSGSGSCTSPDDTKKQKPRKHLAKHISKEISAVQEQEKKSHTTVRVSSTELKLKTYPDSGDRSEFHELSGYSCTDSYKTIKSLEFYLRTPSQILAESQSRASSRSRARNRNRFLTRTRPITRDRTGMSRRSRPSPPPIPSPLRVTLVPFRPPQVGLESRSRTPSRFRYPPPPAPPPKLIFEDAETIRRKLEGYSTTTSTTTSSTTSSFTKLKSRSGILVDLLRKLFLLWGSGGKGVHRVFDPEAEERIKIAKKNKGPLWRVEFFDRDRSQNKLKNKKYALMFDLGYKKSKFRKKEVKLMDNFLHFAKAKRRKLFKKNKYGKKTQRKGRRGEESLRIRDHGKDKDYGPRQGRGRGRGRGMMTYEHNDNNNSNNHVNPQMEYINHVLTRPIAFDKAPMDEDAFNIEPPKVLDFSHLIKSQPSSHPYHHHLENIPHEFSMSREKVSWQDYDPNNNHDGHRHSSLTTITQKRRSSYSRNYSLASLTPLLEDSSKVSEKTLVLLQASRVTSSSQLHFPMNRSLATPNQSGRKSTGELFDPDTLAKIYTPKTDFTRQFASLLPSYNKDAHFSSDFRHF